MTLNDTGQASCLVDGGLEQACLDLDPAEAVQDGNFGRDEANESGQLAKVGGGQAGFDFTKLNRFGDELAIQNAAWDPVNGSEVFGSQWSCVVDNTTGLI